MNRSRSRRAPGRTAYLGTSVVSGFGEGVVTAVGAATLFGRSARLLEERPPESDFERNIRRFSDLLVRVIFLLTAFVFLANALLGKGWFDSFLFAVALAVGITPEVLPAIVSITLANGALRMARDQVVVKRLASVEDLGNVDILCCDKTGTLTLGEFALHDFVGTDGARDPTVLLYGALTGAPGCGVAQGGSTNPTDRAIWASEAPAAGPRTSWRGPRCSTGWPSTSGGVAPVSWCAWRTATGCSSKARRSRSCRSASGSESGPARRRSPKSGVCSLRPPPRHTSRTGSA